MIRGQQLAQPAALISRQPAPQLGGDLLQIDSNRTTCCTTSFEKVLFSPVFSQLVRALPGVFGYSRSQATATDARVFLGPAWAVRAPG